MPEISFNFFAMRIVRISWGIIMKGNKIKKGYFRDLRFLKRV